MLSGWENPSSRLVQTLLGGRTCAWNLKTKVLPTFEPKEHLRIESSVRGGFSPPSGFSLRGRRPGASTECPHPPLTCRWHRELWGGRTWPPPSVPCPSGHNNCQCSAPWRVTASKWPSYICSQIPLNLPYPFTEDNPTALWWLFSADSRQQDSYPLPQGLLVMPRHASG